MGVLRYDKKIMPKLTLFYLKTTENHAWYKCLEQGLTQSWNLQKFRLQKSHRMGCYFQKNKQKSLDFVLKIDPLNSNNLTTLKKAYFWPSKQVILASASQRASSHQTLQNTLFQSVQKCYHSKLGRRDMLSNSDRNWKHEKHCDPGTC